MAEIRWGAATHEGLIREQNEDAFVAEGQVFAVADGMGGHQAGEIASALAAQTVRERLVEGAPSVDVVIATVIEANASIFRAAHSNAGQRGMGTTLTAIIVLAPDGHDEEIGEQPERLALINVGDSRTYLYRGGALRRITVDHSYVQELVATGHISEAEARTHPRRNIVTRALGIEPSVRVDSWELPLVRGDRFVLCSDGLVDEVDDRDISTAVAGIDDPQALAEELVAMANRSGGRDNTTVIVLDVLEGADAAAAAPIVATGGSDAGEDVTGPMPIVTGGPPPLPAMEPVDESVGSATTMMPATAFAPPPPAPPPPGRRRVTARQFLVGLGAALVLMLVIVLVAVALSGGDDDNPPPDTSTDSSVTSVTEPPETTDAPESSNPPRTTVTPTTAAGPTTTRAGTGTSGP